MFPVKVIAAWDHHIWIPWIPKSICSQARKYWKNLQCNLSYCTFLLKSLMIYRGHLSVDSFSLGFFYMVLPYIKVIKPNVIFKRISLTLSCPMDLRLYPLDRQTCHLNMISCKYPCLIIWYLVTFLYQYCYLARLNSSWDFYVIPIYHWYFP